MFARLRLTLFCLALASPAAAAPVFFDDFSGETTGFPQTLTNFEVTQGSVRLLDAGAAGIGAAGQSVVELGSEARLESRSRFAFNAGDSVAVELSAAGAREGSFFATLLLNINFSAFLAITDFRLTGLLDTGSDGFSGAFSGANANLQIDPLAPPGVFGISFRAGEPGTLGLLIRNSNSIIAGPLITSASVEVTPGGIAPPAPIPLPAAGSVLLLGLGLLASFQRRRR